MKILRTKRFIKDLRRAKVSEADEEALNQEITENPEVGDLMVGTGGARKVRFGIGNRGKRSGGRAIYYFIAPDETIWMLAAYSKSDQVDITPDQRRIITDLIKELKD